jgi:hypothetical protein
VTLAELLTSAYAWSESNALALLGVAVAVPLTGTAAAWLAKGGRTERAGRWLASSVVGFGLAVFLLAVAVLLVASVSFGASPLSADLWLLLAPVACLAVAIAVVQGRNTKRTPQEQVPDVHHQGGTDSNGDGTNDRPQLLAHECF